MSNLLQAHTPPSRKLSSIQQVQVEPIPHVAPPAAVIYPRILSTQDPGRYALIVLTLINLLNYIDRYVPSATKQYIEADLGLSDSESSIPLTAFVFVYMLCSPVFSWLADLGYKRNRLIAGGVIIWSIATAAGALAINFWTLLLSRSLVGVGEAAYATIAPALLSDFYPPAKRNAVLSFFYLAIPVGAALGYAIGGEVGKYWGWREAFLVCGAPGLLVAAMCLAITEPGLGAADEPVPSSDSDSTAVGQSLSHVPSLHDIATLDDDNEGEPNGDLEDVGFVVDPELGGPAVTHPHAHGYHPPAPRSEERVPNILVRSSSSSTLEPGAAAPVDPHHHHQHKHLVAPAWKESIIMLVNNPSYMYSTIGLTAVTFAAGGLADWMPSWLNRVHDVEQDYANTLTGAITCVAGIVGTAWGSWAGEYAKGKMKQPYLGVPGINMIITTGCAWVIMIIPNIYAIGILIFIAQVCMWSYTGPITSLTINCVAPNLRVRAFAFQIFLSHALGDAISPTIVGKVSDATDSIRTAMLIVPGAFSICMFTWIVGWIRLRNEDPFDGGQTHVPRRHSTATNGEGTNDLHNPLMKSGSDVGEETDSIRLKRFEGQAQDIM